jgi:steroid 3-oxidase
MEPGSGGSWPAAVCVASIAAALLVAAVIVRCSLGGKRRGGGGGGAAATSSTGEARLPVGSLGLPVLGETPAFIFAAYSPRPESFVEKRSLL